MAHPLRGCFVPLDKIVKYLPDPAAKDGGGKARFFTGFGFDRSRPHELRDALLAHAAEQPIVDAWTDEWGEHWNTRGPLVTPSRRTPIVRVGWVRDSEAPPRLTTALPD